MTLAILLAVPSVAVVGMLILKLVLAALIAYVVFWAMAKIGLPEPFNKIILAIIVIAIAYYLVTLLLSLDKTLRCVRLPRDKGEPKKCQQQDPAVKCLVR